MSPFVAFRSLVLLAAIAVPVHATVTTTGDVNPGGAAVQSDPWDAGISLYVGGTDAGTLEVEAGGVVNGSHGILGGMPGSYGEASVAGSDSRWNSWQFFFCGVWRYW